MSVKTIFKVIIGTVVIMILTSVITELFNVNATATQLRLMSKMAARQSCILFTQETYKQDGNRTGGAVRVKDILDCDNGLFLSGNFYNTSDADEIWNSIYTSTDFKNFCNNTPDLLSNYSDLELLQKAANSNGNISLPSEPGWNSSKDDIQKYNKAIKAQMYYDNKFTTVNLGIPYMDKEITNKMFRYHLAALLSNNEPNLIQKDENGKYFVNYKGFMCYVQDAKINKYDYTVCNLTTSEGRLQFNRLTGMKADNIGYTTSDSFEDNACVTVVGIEYSLPVSYIGVTPIKKVFNFAWNNEVAGYKGEYAGRSTDLQYNYDIKNLVSGGTNGDSTLPSTGKLVYTLVR